MSSALGAGSVVRWSLAVLFGVANARAQAPEPSDLVTSEVAFRAPSGCGSRADLVARILRRSDRIRIEERAASRRLEVELVLEGEQLVATLVLEQPSGRRSSRTLRAADCDEALEAIALVAALSLDPTASTAPEQELPPAPAPSAPPPAPLSEEPAPSPPVERSSESAETTDFGASISLAAQALWGPAPELLPGIGISLVGRLDRASILAPVVRLGYTHSGRSGFAAEQGPGAASFALDAGTLEVCPFRFGTRSVNVLPCPFASGGRLRATGSEALEVQSYDRPWWVVGGSLIGLFRPASKLELQASFTAGIPLIRDTFQFEQGTGAELLHEVPGVSFALGLGAGLAFP